MITINVSTNCSDEVYLRLKGAIRSVFKPDDGHGIHVCRQDSLLALTGVFPDRTQADSFLDIIENVCREEETKEGS